MIKPLVSVLCLTYNHESFIIQAIDSFLNQVTKFPIELVIGLDASSDSTTNILKSYQQKNPDILRIITSNKRVGVRLNAKRTRAACRGRYIAMCEGDDYWIDPYKLQKQFDFLETHPKYSICTHNVVVKNEHGGEESEWLGRNHKQKYTLRDLLKYGSGGATCSLFFRNILEGNYPDWFYTLPGADWALQILLCEKGDMHYFREPMGVYRRHDQGMTKVNNPKDLIRIFDDGGVKLCETFDTHFKGKYHEEITNNLVNYFYPQLIKAYEKLGDDQNIKKYSRLILSNYRHLSNKKASKLFKLIKNSI
jgi:glycosyltransferase involved in cell wall biosynthesis